MGYAEIEIGRLLGRNFVYLNVWFKNKNYKLFVFFLEGKKFLKGNNLVEILGRSGSIKRGRSGRI